VPDRNEPRGARGVSQAVAQGDDAVVGWGACRTKLTGDSDAGPDQGGWAVRGAGSLCDCVCAVGALEQCVGKLLLGQAKNDSPRACSNTPVPLMYFVKLRLVKCPCTIRGLLNAALGSPPSCVPTADEACKNTRPGIAPRGRSAIFVTTRSV